MVENLLKVIYILDSLKRAEHLKMLNVRAAINKDRQWTVWELEADLGVPKTTVSEILTQSLGMKCVVAKSALRLLLPEQKEHCAAVANDLIHTATNGPGFLKVVPGDESWVYGSYLETKAQSSHGSCLVLHTWRRCSKVAARPRPC